MGRRYNTRQRNEVRRFLEMAHGHTTAAELFEKLSETSNISRATVYRQLERLVEEGAVVKATPEGERTACYEIIHEDECHKDACYHLKCERCSKLVHLDCNEVGMLCRHILEKHGFEVNMRKTVVFGLCPECREARS